MKDKKNLIIIIICFFLVIGFYLFFSYSPDNDFVELIKNMAIKNHNDPNLFTEKYKAAVSDEEKLRVVLTNKFYECIYNNSAHIKSKGDVNLYCGHYIKF